LATSITPAAFAKRPIFAQKGAPGERITAKLELKLIADVGLVGLPNAGKSTLISRISAARPKIADYPFTTLVPNLGVVHHRDTTFVVADMPGLIEGASQGIGLGHQFLRHVERNRVLVHVVDAFPIDGSDPVANFHLVERELQLYSPEIFARPRVIALNKVDIVPHGEFNGLRERFEGLPFPMVPISGVTGQGLPVLLDWITDTLAACPPPDTPVLRIEGEAPPDLAWDLERNEDGFVLTGKRLERMVAMTDLENDEALRYLHRRLSRIGVIERLREAGAEEGDEVAIGDFVFSFTDEA
jgi:GTP-binding protein